MDSLHTRLHREQIIGLAVGLAGVLASVVGFALRPHEAFVSWLFALVFWAGLSLGCLNAAMMHYLTGGRWGDAARRLLEAGYMTLPLMAVLFIPLLFGVHQLYPWARPEAVLQDKVLQQKAVYENFTGVLVRGIFFFAAWIIIAVRLRTWSLQQGDTANLAPTIKLRALSGPGIVIVPLTVTFAMVDWVMSIEPAWFSTIFGVILLSGEFLAAISFITVLLVGIRRYEPFTQYLATHDEQKSFHDLANLLLAFVMFWTYVAFSQFLIIYSGNQPHEIAWYLRRIGGNWKWMVAFVAAFHFFVPFFLLLFRAAKRNLTVLKWTAATLFLVHALEIFWAIVPTFRPEGIELHWTDFAAWLGIGGFWLAVFDANLKRHPLLASVNGQDKSAPTDMVHAK